MRNACVLLIVLMGASGVFAAEKPAPDDVVAAMKELRAELEWPGLAVDEAAANLKTPQEALRFVRDDIVLLNYRGSYAGVDGTLRTRAANATDKAMLLATLLQKMNVKVRMARADWPEGATPHQAPGPKRPLPALDKLAKLVAGENPQNTPTADGLTEKELAGLRGEVVASEAAIKEVLAGAGRGGFLDGSPAKGESDARRVNTDWVWVQAQVDGQTWTDLDPVFPDRPRPARVEAPYGFTPATMTVRLEGLREGQAEATPILKWSGSSHAIFGYDLTLTCFPASGDPKAADEPQKVDQWKPVLSCGPLRVAGEAFAPAGGPAKAEEPAEKPAGGGGGFGGLFGGGGAKPAPKPAPSGYDFLRLVIEINDNARPQPWSQTFSRIVQFTGKGYDPNELIAVHRVVLGAGFVPVRVVESRMVDEVLDADQLRRMAEQGDAVKMSPPRGYSSRASKIINSMLFLKLLATPKDMKLVWQGPAVFVETYQLRDVDGQRCFVSRLDTLNEAFAPQPGTSRDLRVRWGLATAATEAFLLKTASVNRHLLDARSGLRLADAPIDGRLSAAQIQKAVLDGGGVLLASADAPDSVWALDPSGDLLAVYVDRHSGVTAKGAGSIVRSEAAGNLYGALGDGALSALGCPAAMLVSPLQAYFQELAKAYIKAASVLEGIGEAIETGDASRVRGGDDYFKNLGRNLTNAMTRGFVKGWAENAAGAGITRMLGTGAESPMVDRVIDGLVSTNISLPPEIPIFTPTIGLAMDLVTLPSQQ